MPEAMSDEDMNMGTAYGMPPEDLHEGAASCGIVAAAQAIQAGQARGMSREACAREAHQAAELAYQAFVAAQQHADHHDAQVCDEGDVVEHVGATAIERHHGVGAYVVRRPPIRGIGVVHDPHVHRGPIVGHGGGHGGGGHGGHGHHGGPFLLGGGWGPDYWGSPVVLACGPGQMLLPDGTCFPPAAYGYHVGEVEVGAPIGATFLAADEDGVVTLPDGSTVHVDSIELGNVASVGAALVGQGTEHGRHIVGQSMHVGQGDNLGPAAGSSGTTASSSPEADAIEANWVAVLQAKSQVPGWSKGNETKLQSDHSNWEAFYAHIKNGETLYMLQDVSPWQTIVDEWGDAMRAMAPNVTSWPANFPTQPGGAGLSTTPLQVPSLPDASGLASALQWGVIAIAVGVGLWLFWPVLVGAKGLMAAL
jgi:hypothetical protein